MGSGNRIVHTYSLIPQNHHQFIKNDYFFNSKTFSNALFWKSLEMHGLSHTADVSTSITPLGSFQTQTFGSEGSVESMDDGLFLAWGRCREKLYFQAPRTPLNVFNDKLVQTVSAYFFLLIPGMNL